VFFGGKFILRFAAAALRPNPSSRSGGSRRRPRRDRRENIHRKEAVGKFVYLKFCSV
jgi:hypothetical protein